MQIAHASSREFGSSIVDSVVVLPIGAIEGHGPHLPLATDTMIAAHVAQSLEAVLPSIACLPAIHHGPRNVPAHVGGEIPGTVNVRMSTTVELIVDLIEACYREGARRFAVVNGHMANVGPMFEALDIIASMHADTRLLAASWWDLTTEELRNDIARETGVPRDVDHHGAMVETSLMLHAHPDRVRVDLMTDESPRRRPRYAVLPTPADVRTDSGIVFSARKASAEIGERVLAQVIANLRAAVELDLA